LAADGLLDAGAVTNVAKEWDGAPKKSCRLEDPWDKDRPPVPDDAEGGIGLITRRPACVPWGTVRTDDM
jgi:hypothetical protein